MAGHSKWANIQHRKGRQDAVRSKLFSKLSKEITVAAKMGDPDPDKNPRLRLAVKQAKSQSMPNDNIDRAIKKSQAGEGDDYKEIRYEGYGPNEDAMAQLFLWVATTDFDGDEIIWTHRKLLPNPKLIKDDGPLIAFRKWSLKFWPDDYHPEPQNVVNLREKSSR